MRPRLRRRLARLSWLCPLACATWWACGGAPIAPESPPEVDVPTDEVMVRGPHVRDEWLGAGWDGSPSRLVTPTNAPEPVDCTAPPSTATASAAETVRGDDGTFTRLTPTSERRAPACSSPHEWRVVATVQGGWMRWSGVPGAQTPGDVLAGGGVLLDTLGWRVAGGAWIPGDTPVAARLSRAEGDVMDACANTDGPDVAEALARAALRARLASPTPAADAVRQVDLLLVEIGGHAQQAARGAPEALAADCGHSPAWRVARLLGAGTQVAPAEGAVGDAGPASLALHALAAVDALAFDRADAWLSGALARDPHAPMAAFVRARLDELTGASNAVVTQAYARATTDPGLAAAATYALGLLAEDRGDLAAAMAWYEQAADQDLRYAEPMNALGYLAFQDGDPDAAIHYFEAALERDPTHVGACNNLGFIAETALDDPDLALTWYRRAVDLDPSTASALFNLGHLLERRYGELEEARGLYVAALEAEPSYRDASEALASLDARPAAGVGAITGMWEGTSSAGHPVLVSITPDAVAVVRRTGGGASTDRFSGQVAWLRGPRIAFTAQGGGAALVVELVGVDDAWLYREDTPTERTRIVRRDGGVAQAF